MKGYYTSYGYMGYVNGQYRLFATESDYIEYVTTWHTGGVYLFPSPKRIYKNVYTLTPIKVYIISWIPSSSDGNIHIYS